MQYIEVKDLNDQLIEVSLDGSLFFVHLTWNESAKQFFLGLQSAESEEIINGIGVVPNYPLLWRFRRQTMPLGDLTVFKNLAGPIDRNSFLNGSADLVYLTEADLEVNNLIDLYGRI